MSKEHLSEDQRILALEQSIPEIQRMVGGLSDRLSLLQVNTSGLGLIQPQNPLVDSTRLEQILALLQIPTIFPAPVPPPTVVPSATILADSACIKVKFDGDPVKSGHTVMLEDSGLAGSKDPNDCFTISRPLVYDGHAEVVVCCKDAEARPGRDCSSEFASVTLRDPAKRDPVTGKPQLISALLLQFGCASEPV